MDLKLRGKRALVTGSSRGIGRAIALSLADFKVDVAINYLRNRARAEETAQEIEALSPDIGKGEAALSAPVIPSPGRRQASLFKDEMDRVRDALEKIDIEATTPLQALMKLKELKDLLP